MARIEASGIGSLRRDGGDGAPIRGDARARHVEVILVRWGDMDTMGHVNNAKYFTYCESARMSYFAAVRMLDHRASELQLVSQRREPWVEATRIPIDVPE